MAKSSKDANLAWRRDPSGKKARVLDVARDMFLERGFGETRTADIAERSGVSVGSLFQYFSTKDGLLSAVVERYAHGMVMVLQEIFDPATTPDATVIVASLFDYIHMNGRPVMSVVQRQSTPGTNPVAQHETILVDALTTMVAGWQANGHVGAGSARQLATIYFNLVSGGITGCFVDDGGRNEQQWRAVTARCLGSALCA